MDVAGLLLTGGASRRMGRPKADLPYAGTSLARHLGGQLAAACAGPALEVGPGRSDLRSVADDRPGAGPLAAVVTGAAALRAQGWTGPVLVVATDLPGVTTALLRLLADAAGPGSAVPVDRSGRRQPLCARYGPADLARAAAAVVRGERAVRAALSGAADVVELAPSLWEAVGGAAALTDVDVPDDLAAAGIPDGAGP